MLKTNRNYINKKRQASKTWDIIVAMVTRVKT